MATVAHPSPAAQTVRTRCPGRVTVIGDHTDYCEGVSLAVATDLATEVTLTVEPGSTTITLVSNAADEPAEVDVDGPADPGTLAMRQPPWSRLVAAVAAVVRPGAGGHGTVRSTVPVGAGLSSSAALTVATALAFGLQGEPLVVARTCQHAERVATGVDVGLLDPWAVTEATAGTAVLLDFRSDTATTVRWPEDLELVVVHSDQRRTLARSGYQARRAECDAAAYRLGPLGHVDPSAVLGLPDPVLRRRARHVVTECDRVRWFVEALRADDRDEAGRLMVASHRSLADDFEVSTARLDQLVDDLVARPGVHGARLTGAGFGGCVVAIAEAGALDPATLGASAWRVRPADGARVVDSGHP
jgi:galactokinase